MRGARARKIRLAARRAPVYGPLMALALHAHPFSSYSQKALIALWENDLSFDYRRADDPEAAQDRLAHWPFGLFPILVDGDETIAETSIIIEYLDTFYPGRVRFIPDCRRAALEVRFMDRFFDNHVMATMQRPVFEALKGSGGRLAEAMSEAHRLLDIAYAFLNRRLAGRIWAAGDAFSLADCAAAPALFYADWVSAIAPAYPAVRAYRQRLLARPSFARAVEEARPYRPLFPLGAPDRD